MLALPAAATDDSFDVVVYGGTPGSISAALSAARHGRRVALVEYHPHVGGMMTSGLGKCDIQHRAMIGGLFKEMIQRVHSHYITTYGADHENVRLCRNGYFFEPSVSQAIFAEMLREQPRITVLTGWRFRQAGVEDDRLTSLDVVHRQSGEVRKLGAPVFIDATYEGDFYAAAGAAFRLGRESRDEFSEPHAGVVYF